MTGSVVPTVPVFPFMRLRFTRLDALLLGMTLIWGSNFTIIKAALREIPELGFNALRMVLGSIVFAAVIQHRHGIRALIARLDSREWAALAGLGVGGHFVYQWLFMSGVARTSVANSSLILSDTLCVSRCRPIDCG